MMRRVGWRTATARSRGNHSSRWRYRRGASVRASIAPLSDGASADGTATGRGGRCACGPQAHASPRPSVATYRRLDRKTMPHCALRALVVTIHQGGPAPIFRAGEKHIGGPMRKPRPATYNPVQALHLIANDRNGSPLSCPSCSGQIERTPDDFPPPPRSQVTLQCRECGRVARYIAGAA